MAIAQTKQGPVEGREKDGVQLFSGIPYAAPPVGELRFRPPQPHPAWDGVRPAQQFGFAAPQVPSGGLTDGAPVKWDEDCLTLNVSTPGADDKRRPVLVWIHGGGFRTGQGAIPWYNGASFARRGDIVTVSINYRLGALGFANLAQLGSDYASSGLNGIQDQIAALEWVRDNIAAFGGDPEQVTIAGESAGGMSVGILLGSPRAQGLFRAAIAQSGAAHHVLSSDVTNEVGSKLLQQLGVDSSSGLQAVTTQQILDAQIAVEAGLAEEARSSGDDAGIGGMAFQPTVDGAVLPEPPADAIRGGLAKNVRVMIGTNRHETTLFGYKAGDDARLARVAARMFGDGEAALATYRKAQPRATNDDLLTALTTDHMFRIPAVRLAEAHTATGGTSYKYLFTWESRAFKGRLKATHALEIPFAFNNLERAGVDVFLGPGPRPDALAAVMHEAWIAFIRSGDPNTEGLPEWPAYDAKRRPVMEFGDRIGALDDPGGSERALWEGLR